MWHFTNVHDLIKKILKKKTYLCSKTSDLTQGSQRGLHARGKFSGSHTSRCCKMNNHYFNYEYYLLLLFYCFVFGLFMTVMKWIFCCCSSFFCSVLLMAQIFALMPVEGITSNSSDDLRFSWTSVRTWYSFIATVLIGICSAFNIAYAFRGVFNFDSVGKWIFCGWS